MSVKELFGKFKSKGFAQDVLSHVGVRPDQKGASLSPEQFSDGVLLQLFDPHQVFQNYGILSPVLETHIARVQRVVAAQRARAASGDEAASKDGKDGHSQEHAALDRTEFCALLHLLDALDDRMFIVGNEGHNAEFRLGEDSPEMRIANIIFRAYGRAKEKKVRGWYRTGPASHNFPCPLETPVPPVYRFRAPSTRVWSGS